MFLVTFWIKYPRSSHSIDISMLPFIYLFTVNICVHVCVCMYVSTSVRVCAVMRDV